MFRSVRDGHQTRQRKLAASTVVWNAVVPALGLALILGVSLLPAVAIAGAVAIAIEVALAPASRRDQWRRRLSAPRPVVRGS